MNTSQSLERGLMVLELLDASPAPLGVREIARQLDLSTTIIQRLVNTLAAYKYLEQAADTRRYRIGPRSLGLGSALLRHDKLISGANAELQQLATEGLSGFLGVLRGVRAVYLLAVQGRGPIAVRAIPGEMAYLHSTAMGKVLLSALNDGEVRNLLAEQPLPKLTEKTIHELPALLADLGEVRRLGYATSINENLSGVISVGAPIRNANGQVSAALSVAFAASGDGENRLDDAIKRILAATLRQSRNLGCPEALLPVLSPDLDAA